MLNSFIPLCLPTTPALVRTPSKLNRLLPRTSLKGSQGLQASARAPQPCCFLAASEQKAHTSAREHSTGEFWWAARDSCSRLRPPRSQLVSLF